MRVFKRILFAQDAKRKVNRYPEHLHITSAVPKMHVMYLLCTPINTLKYVWNIVDSDKHVKQHAYQNHRCSHMAIGDFTVRWFLRINQWDVTRLLCVKPPCVNGMASRSVLHKKGGNTMREHLNVTLE